MDRSQAVEMIVNHQLNHVSFKRATFADIPSASAMEYGWFDLTDQDHNGKVEGNHLILEVWFSDARMPNVPQDAVIESKHVRRDNDFALWRKLRVSIVIEDLDYTVYEGKRVYF